MGASETSQASAISRLLNKKGGVVCGPGYGDGGTKTGCCVRSGEDVAVGCTVTVDNAKSTGDDQTYLKRSKWVQDALAKAGYRYDVAEVTEGDAPYLSRVVLANVRLMVRPATGKVVTNKYRTRKQPVHAKAVGGVVTVGGADCLDGFTEDGRRVYLEIHRGEHQSEGDALRELARRLLEIAAKRDEYSR